MVDNIVTFYSRWSFVAFPLFHSICCYILLWINSNIVIFLEVKKVMLLLKLHLQSNNCDIFQITHCNKINLYTFKKMKMLLLIHNKSNYVAHFITKSNYVNMLITICQSSIEYLIWTAQ